MKRAVALALLLAAALPGARAQYLGGAVPSAPGIINMSLMEALVAIKHPELAGVFAYVPDAQTSVAMADFLMREHGALKRFLKKVEADHKKLKLVNGWDKEVCLHIVAATANRTVPPGAEALSKRLYDRVSLMSLAVGVPLEVVIQRRAAVR
ncbi:hypothetical protein EPO15_07350 [bacterium]|nr:MAG: hypothetical protein EPO15_07350 [bacterium]